MGQGKIFNGTKIFTHASNVKSSPASHSFLHLNCLGGITAKAATMMLTPWTNRRRVTSSPPITAHLGEGRQPQQQRQPPLPGSELPQLGEDPVIVHGEPAICDVHRYEQTARQSVFSVVMCAYVYLTHSIVIPPNNVKIMKNANYENYSNLS